MPDKRRFEAGLQLLEDGGRLGRGDIERADGIADRGHRLEQAPEGAEQAEEDQKADQIARDIARFVEPGGQRIEQRAHRQRATAPSGWAGRGTGLPSAPSNFGVWVSSRPGLAIRKPLTQLISGHSRQTMRKE